MLLLDFYVISSMKEAFPSGWAGWNFEKVLILPAA